MDTISIPKPCLPGDHDWNPETYICRRCFTSMKAAMEGANPFIDQIINGVRAKRRLHGQEVR